MGYLPSFLPTEIFVSNFNENDCQPNGFLPFNHFSSTPIDVNQSSGFRNPNQSNNGNSVSNNNGINLGNGNGNSVSNNNGINLGNGVGTNPNDNSSNVGGGNGNGNGNGNNNPQMSNGICPAVYFPVCANGQTFPNACEAQKAGFTQLTQGECATNNGGDNGNGSGDNGDTFPITDPETGCLIQGFDMMGNPIYIDVNGNQTTNPVGCRKEGGNNGGGVVDNGNGGVDGGGGSIPDDEKIIAFVKKNWMYLLAVTAGIYLLTNKSN